MRTFSCPWPTARRKRPILPVFLPFAGCRVRCVYCAQDLQTGTDFRGVKQALEGAWRMLQERSRRFFAPCEVAFYGGTFTNLPAKALEECVLLAGSWVRQGLVCGWRCSTRPDAVPRDVLSFLRDNGCVCVELGIQSFDDRVLALSRRGYTGARAREGMANVLAADLTLGVQLLPGLPGGAPSSFLADVSQALAGGAAFLRFYPCLVVEGTELALLWREGRYRPWELETTVDTLAEGVLLAHGAGVSVARIGVAVDASFEGHVLAGPRDANLGTRVLSRALVTLVERHVPAAEKLVEVRLPRAAQGYLFGQGGENRARLARLGLTGDKMVWGGEETVCIRTE